MGYSEVCDMKFLGYSAVQHETLLLGITVTMITNQSYIADSTAERDRYNLTQYLLCAAC